MQETEIRNGRKLIKKSCWLLCQMLVCGDCWSHSPTNKSFSSLLVLYALFTQTTTAQYQTHTHFRVCQPGAIPAPESTADLKPPPTSQLFTKTHKDSFLYPLKIPLSDPPCPHRICNKKIKQTLCFLQSEAGWESRNLPGKMSVSLQLGKPGCTRCAAVNTGICQSCTGFN